MNEEEETLFEKKGKKPEMNFSRSKKNNNNNKIHEKLWMSWKFLEILGKSNDNLMASITY